MFSCLSTIHDYQQKSQTLADRAVSNLERIVSTLYADDNIHFPVEHLLTLQSVAAALHSSLSLSSYGVTVPTLRLFPVQALTAIQDARGEKRSHETAKQEDDSDTPKNQVASRTDLVEQNVADIRDHGMEDTATASPAKKPRHENQTQDEVVG